MEEAAFWESIHLSIVYTVWTVALQLLIGVCAAMYVYSMKSGASFSTIILLLPYAIPSVVAIVSWEFLLKSKGFAAELIEVYLGISSGYWMGSGIFVTLIIVSAWQFYPFVFMAVLAQLKTIPADLFRTAELDGARPWQTFLFVTLPQLKNVLLAVLLLRVAFMFTKYDTPRLLGGGTAIDQLNILPIYLETKLNTVNSNQVSAAAVLFSGIIAIVLGGIYFLYRTLFGEQIRIPD
jgi:multiple sugar transport system permease protein